MKTYTEKELRDEYDRGVYNGKAEFLRDLTSVINSGYGKSYVVAYNLVTSFYELSVSRLKHTK